MKKILSLMINIWSDGIVSRLDIRTRTVGRISKSSVTYAGSRTRVSSCVQNFEHQRPAPAIRAVLGLHRGHCEDVCRSNCESYHVKAIQQFTYHTRILLHQGSDAFGSEAVVRETGTDFQSSRAYNAKTEALNPSLK